MTIGENIKKIRLERHITQKELGKLVGVNESYIRAYESGKRNPKQQSLEKLAEALHVNIEVLTASDFDETIAMQRLFQIYKQFNGELFEYVDQTGKNRIVISFKDLHNMKLWYERYKKYVAELNICNSILDETKRKKVIDDINNKFDIWMDIFPESER